MEYAHGGDIYAYGNITDFSANINPFKMPPQLSEAVASGIDALGNYPDCSCRALREKIAKYAGCEANDVICGNGAADLIFSIVYAHRPKKALLTAPCFTEYEAALTAIDTDIRYYMLSPENDFALLPDFEEMLTADLDMVFLCVPNNPTGGVIDKKRLISIADICEENGILLVLDECFNEFLDTPQNYSMIDETAGREHLVILKSFTKMYALAGLRLGYAISCNHALFEKIYRQRQPWPVSSLAQRAGIAALDQTVFAENSRNYLLQERGYLAKGLQRLGCRVFEGKANFIFFYCKNEIKTQLLKKGILIRDCSNYRGLTKGYYRIAVRTHDDNVRLLKAMRIVLEEGET